MTDYTNTFGGAAKDATGSTTILGADHDTQYDALATMSATKSNKIAAPTTGNLLQMDGGGDLADAGVTLAALKDLLEPIGTIYHSTVATNPGTSKGFGTWVQIAKGRTLIGEGTGAGLTARTAAAELGQEDSIIPEHNHDITDPGHAHTVDLNSSSANQSMAQTGTNSVTHTDSTRTATTGITIDNEGESATDGNLQPSLVVYIWERTA